MSIALTTLLSLGAKTASGTTSKPGHGAEFTELLEQISSSRAAPTAPEGLGNGSGFSAGALLPTELLDLASLPAPSNDAPVSAAATEPAPVASDPPTNDEVALGGSNAAGMADARAADGKNAAVLALLNRAAPTDLSAGAKGNSAG